MAKKTPLKKIKIRNLVRTATCTPKKYCSGMADSVEYNGNGKGLVTVQIYDLQSTKLLYELVVYKSKPSSRGIVLNVCPWCKANLLPKALKRKKS